MLLEALIWHGFQSASMLSDAGLQALVKGEPADSTMAFTLDTQAFRDALKLRDTPLCDGLFVGMKRLEGREPQIFALFVELKGKNFNHALKQLEEAVRLFRDHLRATLPPMAFGRSRTAAVIVSDRAAPQQIPPDVRLRFKKDLKSTLFVRAAIRKGPPVDLSNDLWQQRTDNSAATDG